MALPAARSSALALGQNDCWTSNSDSLVGRFSAPMKRLAKDTMTDDTLRADETANLPGSGAARIPTCLVAASGRRWPGQRQPCQFVGKIRSPLEPLKTFHCNEAKHLHRDHLARTFVSGDVNPHLFDGAVAVHAVAVRFDARPCEASNAFTA